MIKFFRKFRQKNLSENKFSKYLIYAIGEIILVVIGILIALGINNWKENQTEIKQQNLIFENLNLELNNNLKNLNSKLYQTFIQFRNLVESDYTTTRNVKEYAYKMNVSTKHLNQVVKDFSLSTAKSFIDEYVILEAKRAIVSTDKSIKEIAFKTGFDELTNFTKFFKKRMNISPKDFRNSQV